MRCWYKCQVAAKRTISRSTPFNHSSRTKNQKSKMKSFFVVALFVAAALAAPQRGPDADAQILRFDADNIGLDGYSYAVETSNGIKQEESGQLKNAGSENEAISVRGSFSYTGPDGVVYTVQYVADENGFQPQGAHLPVAP